MTAAERSLAPVRYYVAAAGRVWGPYGFERLDGFVAEGRVAPATLVGESPEGPFLPAGRHPDVGRLFGAPSASAAPQPATGRERPLLVWASAEARRLESVEQLLIAHGPHLALGPGLWLVRARLGPAALRNALTRRLSREDALLVVEAPLEQVAWFNLSTAAEPAVRRLWAADSSEG